MSVASAIETKLAQAFAPERLVIEDQSHLHAGHAGHRPGGESHFRVELVSARFAGLNRVARQRLVYDVLATELAGPIHALALKTLAPGE
jgi:BolA protein